MRRPRVKVEGEGFYHVVSRIAGRRFLLDDAEKGILLGMIRAAATFSGVELYTYAVMSNHFHLLVRVPRKREVDEKELLRRMEALYGTPRFLKVLEKWERWTNKHQTELVEEEKARLRARMYDLSQFCKTFKETFSQNYNKRHDYTGSIWEGRFKSILLEGSWRTLMTVAGYIHLNPVRAEITEQPEAAKHAGYGAACQGDTRAMTGLVSLVKRVYGIKEATWELARTACADVIAGALPQTTPTGGPSPPADDSPRPLHDLLRHRVAGFLHGGALGGTTFLARAKKRLPPRIRERPKCSLDACTDLGLAPARGVRERNKDPAA